MKFIVVQISKKRFAIAEQTSDTTYKVITNKISTRWEAEKVRNEIDELDYSDYSELTKRMLHAELN